MSETNADKVRRYTECLTNGVDTKRALKRLYDLDVTLDAYNAADTYRVVKRFESMPEFAKYVGRLKDKIKKMHAAANGGADRKRDRGDESSSGGSELKKPKREPNTDEMFQMAMGGAVRSQSSAPRVAVDYSKFKVTKRVEPKIEPKDEPVDDYELQPCSSSQQPPEPVRKPQKEYAPSLPPSLLKPPQHHKPHIPQSASLRVDESQFKPRKERQKVFAGRRRKVGEGVPSLISLCQDVLASNVHMIDHVGIVPYELLKPALHNATVEQLRHILDVNPILAEDADQLFQERVVHEFPKYADRDLGDWSWRELYDQLVERKEKKESAKLEMLTSRIGKSHNANDQGRRTMVIDMAHTRVKSKSFFTSARDTQVKMLNTPSAIQLSQARKHVKSEGKAQLASITPRGGLGPSTSRRSGGGGGGGAKPGAPKVAPLMAKCRKMLKR